MSPAAAFLNVIDLEVAAQSMARHPLHSGYMAYCWPAEWPTHHRVTSASCFKSNVPSRCRVEICEGMRYRVWDQQTGHVMPGWFDTEREAELAAIAMNEFYLATKPERKTA